MNIKPLGDRVLVQRIEEEVQKSAGGIIIPDTAKEKPQMGKVVAVGDGRRDDQGKRVPLDISAGDEVFFGKYAGNEIKVNGTEYLIMREDDVIAKRV
ncbi:MAG TPA: co-chaperone GroES [Candidatus Sumerlaeota bacterium]|nr:co-chaperone GroES [Candidatus Sumerlaeota bacterium]HPK03435.1 co-chaperone GroES [Candidatus Sumerlaeota bacterium]